MSTFGMLLNVRLISITFSVILLTLRFWWRYTDPRSACARWTHVVSPAVDAVLLPSDVALIVKVHILLLIKHRTWLTEKLFGVTACTALGFIALNYRRMCNQQVRLIAPPLALVTLYIIIKSATAKIPLLG